MHTAERTSAGDWFPGTPAGDGTAAPRLDLICFPHAGGTASAYRDWTRHLGDRVRTVPVQLPGRGLRLRETPYTSMGPLAAAVADALTAHGLVEHYALFGHSMGALLAYEVACALRGRGLPGPVHLFVSGSRAPHLYGDRADRLLRDDDLRRLVGDLGGVAPDDTVGRAYLERRLPVLRADLAVCETYRWTPRPPLDCPTTAFCATGDPIATAPEMEPWRAYTRGSLLLRRPDGDHFFLSGPARPSLLRDIRGELVRHLDPPERQPTPEKEHRWTY